MTCNDNQREPEPAYLRSDQRINDMAELLNMRRERIDALGAELETAQERIAALEAESAHWRERHREASNTIHAFTSQGIGTALAEANARIRELELERQANRNTINELKELVAQRRDPPGSYLVRSPGVYVVTPSQHSAVGLDVYRHELKDAVVLTARPDEEPASWWQLYRDGINGELTAWHPPEYMHNAIVRTAMAMRDPSEKPWVGIDPAKPDDDMTTVGLRVERRVDRLEQQMAAKLTEVSHPTHEMARRMDRLEAWARQFDGVRVHKSVQASGPLVEMRGPMVEMRALDIKPLDHLEPKG